MPKKVFHGDLVQLAKIQKIFAGNPKVAVEIKKTLSIFGNESSKMLDTKVKGVALGNEGLIFTFKDGLRYALNIGDEISISKSSPKKRYSWEPPAPSSIKVSFTNSVGEKVTIIKKV